MQRIQLTLIGFLLANTLQAATLQESGISSLRQAVEHAAINNPAILASWNAFKAADQGKRAAKGGYYPSVDLSAEVGEERTEDVLDNNDTFSTSSARLTITQMLFDGFATKNEVAQQGFFKLARYYEFKQASEEIALETSQAFLDIQRFRALVELAKENLIQHRRYHRDIEDRVKSGIGRGVDLEQARARLALAESNLLTETTNLHDVTTRFYRLVGLFPNDNLEAIAIAENLIPKDRRESLEKAFINNPQLNASIENIRAADAETRRRKSPMSPRLDLRFRKQIDENDRGVDGTYDEEAIELVLSYNLYRGGTDRALKRQSNYLLYEAFDNRERICREVRQTVSIAHNDVVSNTQLIKYLEQNAEAIAKARKAYKKQFDIGQRTLLDLLDTENEYFEVRRTLTTARSEITLAKLRTLAGMGLLTASLNINGIQHELLEDLNLDRDDDLNAKCPAIGPKMSDFNVTLSDLAIDENQPFVPREAEVIKLNVNFEHQSATLSLSQNEDIQNAANLLCKNPATKGFVEGHTDSSGSITYNQNLSQARSEEVLNKLISICDSISGRLKAIGYGESRPIADNKTSEGRSKNRRVELVIPKTAENKLTR